MTRGTSCGRFFSFIVHECRTFMHLHPRPETIESLFLAYRLTGDDRYREYGWAIFQAIERHCRIPSGGYASVLDVDRLPVKHEDKMETFLMVRLPPLSVCRCD